MNQPSFNHPNLPDQKARDVFSGDTRHSLAIVASAGSGKTTAIVQRIVALANREDAKTILPCLVLVTYTKTAAEEMQQRAREEILKQTTNSEIIEAFNRAFFGTIHSFCVLLLRQYGHFIDVPAHFDTLENDVDDTLWFRFRQTIGNEIRKECSDLDDLARHVRLSSLIETARTWSGTFTQEVPPFEEPDLREVFAFANFKSNAKETGQKEKKKLQYWQNQKGFRGIPLVEYGGAEFTNLCKTVFQKLHEWRMQSATRFIHVLAERYRDFRRTESAFTYHDQVYFAKKLFDHPIAAQRIRERGYHILLDEGQDTDPLQFELLFNAALNSKTHVLEKGRFCVVGDPQQAIYWSRANLKMYEQIRHKLENTLTFTTTMRCSKAVVEGVNTVFPSLLTGQKNQAVFVKLNAKHNAAEGQILCFKPQPNISEKSSKEQIIEAEASEIAQWLKQHGHKKLRANSWADVAILCYTRKDILAISKALEEAGLPFINASENEKNSDVPAYRWITALLLVLSSGKDAWEMFGVLREIYGIPDAEIAAFAQGDETKLQLPQTENAPAIFQELEAIRCKIRTMPLSDAVRTVMTHCQLQERLNQVTNATEDNRLTLRAVLIESIRAEENKQTLAEFARSLFQKLNAKRVKEKPQNNAITLITNHSAKGLEWQAVILPFLAKDSFKNFADRYPAIDQGDDGSATVVCDNCEYEINGQKWNAANLRNLDRLLYVAFTRAKQTLVLIDDRELFKRTKKSQKNTPFSRLEQDPEFYTWLESLPDTGMETDTLLAEKPVSNNIAKPLRPIEEKDYATALTHAENFLHRASPHQFAHPPAEEDPEAIRERTEEPAPVQNDGTAYGTWWHHFMENLNWLNPDSHEACFQEALQASPNIKRSKQEWEKFQNSGFIQKLAVSGGIYHSEFPFLRKAAIIFEGKEDSQAIEGFMDLAIYNPHTNHWLLVDWKTDREADISELHRRYAPQLLAYSDALFALTGASAEAEIYSTFNGIRIPIKNKHALT